MSERDVPDADSHQPKDDGNFLHVVIYAAIALILGFFLAFLLLRTTGKKLVPGKHNPHPTSEVVRPVSRAMPV
jgi:hypothetical protein